ncbi:MAG: hypothetical protein U5K79_15085 [Cyclobacteriaceae bacterium]|nr:hypothetical protein [Cyclobacteriaceae bacterium]
MKLSKTLLLLALLLAGVVPASIASTNPDEKTNNDTQDIVVLASEALTNDDGIGTMPLNEEQQNHRYKIYNANKKLVYECRDADDARLKSLLKRSDLLLTTDSSSYYYLAD